MNFLKLKTNKTSNFSFRLHSRKAFTLLEIMSVVIIIGMLLAFLIPRLTGTVRNAGIKTANAMINGTFKTSLGLYEMENGHFPSTEQGLKALAEKPSGDPPALNWRPYFDSKVIPKDPWNNDYIYVCPGQHNTDTYDLSSKGPDGIDGNEDDIKNW